MIPLFYVLWPALMMTALHHRNQIAAAAPVAPPPPAEAIIDQAANVVRFPAERTLGPLAQHDWSAEVVELRLRRRV